MDELTLQPQSPPKSKFKLRFGETSKPFFLRIKNWVSTRKKTTLIAMGVLAMAGAAVLYIANPFGRGGRVTLKTSGLTLKPTLEDSLGVAAHSAFILSSKDPVKLSEVEASLQIEPQARYRITKQGGNEFKIAFADPLTDGEIYTFQLAIEEEDQSETGPSVGTVKNLSWAFQVKSAFRIVQALPRDEATGVPLDSGIEVTFSHDNYEDVDSFFEITPNVQGRFERHKRTAAFISKGLEPGTLYTVRIRKGLGLGGSEETLADDYVFQFETSSYSKDQPRYWVGFDREISEFASGETPVFSLYLSQTEDLPELEVDVYRFTTIDQFLESLKERDEIPLWAHRSRERFRRDPSGLEKVLSFSAPIEKLDYSGYFAFPESILDGYYLVEASLGERRIQTWLEVTDIASYLSTSETKTLAWINDVGAKAPVARAELELVGGSLKKQSTNDQGVAFFETPDELKDSKTRRYFKIKTSGGKTAVVPVASTGQYGGYWSWSYYRGYRSATVDAYWSYLYLDRPLYQPTDTVNFWGLIKSRDRPRTDEGFQLTVTRRDYYGYHFQPLIISEQTIQPNDLGTYVGDISLSNLQPGYYNIDIKSGENTIVSRGFQVLTYTKPAYKIDVEPDRRAVFGGETVAFAGQTSFFEGTPVPKVGLKYSGSVSGQTTANAHGEFEIVYQTEYSERDEHEHLIRYPRPQNINVNPSLAEEGEIIGGARLAVFGSDAALKASTEIVGSNGTVAVEVNRIVLDRLNDGNAEGDDDYLGDPLADQSVSGALYENRWEKEEVGEYYDFINKVVRKKYHYRNVRDFLSEISLVTDRRGQTVYEFTLDPDKYYIVELETVGSRGRTNHQTVYLYGTRYNYFGHESNYYHLDSGDPAVRYSVGDAVSLTFKNGNEVLPSGGENRYLFNVAQRGIRDFRPQNSPTFEFEFEDAYVPNVVVAGIYFNGRTFFDGGSSLVRFDTQDKKLSITVSPDKPSYRPGEQVNLDVAVVDGEGRGQRAEVNISLVDEALFKLKDQSVDTLGSLYRAVGSGVFQTYVSHQYPLDLAGAEGGGCFLAGTKIRMSDGPDRNIEDIEVGDLILTRGDEHSSQLVAAKVVKTFEHIVGGHLLINDFLEVTPEHNLFVNGRWTVAEDVRPGDYLLSDRNQWFEVVSIESFGGRFEVHNLEVEKQRTFFADGVFVHNQKGREFFADQAFFGVVQTDGGGRGRVDFKLPDNLTSWRITYQGISESLGAGYGTRLLPVKLPLFVDVVLNEEYLVADKPIIKLRAFGESLSPGQEVEFELKAPTLGLEKGLKILGRAFEAAPFELPSLSEGEHQLSITARSGGLEDTLIRKIRVYRSRLTRGEVNYYRLAEDTSVVGSEQYPTTLIFSDQNCGRYYSILTRLAHAFGDRIDQKLARIKARQLLSEYFDENIPPEALDPSNYQTPQGGLGLFPYSDADLALSAKIVAVAGDEFDQAALQQYFLGILNDPDESRERSVVALYGLAALDEPVLVVVNNLLAEPDLSAVEELYLGLAAVKLGNHEAGRDVLKKVVEKYGEEFRPGIRLKVGRDQDDILEATSLAADLAALLNEYPKDELLNYMTRNRTTDVLIYLEDLIYASQALAESPGEAVEFTYLIDGRKTTKKLGRGDIFKVQVSPEELASLEFEGISGRVGLASFYTVPFSAQEVRKDNNIAVGRTYRVADRTTTELSESDLVKVTLDYELGPQALSGCYQVSDLLPSGLKAVTRPYSWSIHDEDVWYPYEIVGQKISFCVTPHYDRPISYYARVISRGEYQAEGAVIQSLQSVDSLNISPSATVKIR